MPQWASRRLAGYGETELFLELARMVVESTGVRDLDAILQDAAAPAASQRTFLDPQAALEQSSSPLGPSATRHRRDDPGSVADAFVLNGRGRSLGSHQAVAVIVSTRSILPLTSIASFDTMRMKWCSDFA